LGEAPQALGRTYIIGGERAVTLNELVASVADALGATVPRGRLPLWPLKTAAHICEALCRPLGIEPPIYPRRVDFFYKTRSFDISRVQKELKFKPQVSLAKGLKRTAEWYRQENLL